jgi:hypothetical protein
MSEMNSGRRAQRPDPAHRKAAAAFFAANRCFQGQEPSAAATEERGSMSRARLTETRHARQPSRVRRVVALGPPPSPRPRPSLTSPLGQEIALACFYSPRAEA